MPLLRLLYFLISQGCINLAECEIYQDEEIKRRFTVYSHLEDRSFLFESVLDVDFAEWFYAISNNIEVRLDGFVHCSDSETMEMISEVGMKMIMLLQGLESQGKLRE